MKIENKLDIEIPKSDFKVHFLRKITFETSDLEILNTKTARELYIFSVLVKKQEKLHFQLQEVTYLEFIIIEKQPKNNVIIEHHLAQFDDANYVFINGKVKQK